MMSQNSQPASLTPQQRHIHLINAVHLYLHSNEEESKQNAQESKTHDIVCKGYDPHVKDNYIKLQKACESSQFDKKKLLLFKQSLYSLAALRRFCHNKENQAFIRALTELDKTENTLPLVLKVMATMDTDVKRNEEVKYNQQPKYVIPERRMLVLLLLYCKDPNAVKRFCMNNNLLTVNRFIDILEKRLLNSHVNDLKRSNSSTNQPLTIPTARENADRRLPQIRQQLMSALLLHFEDGNDQKLSHFLEENHPAVKSFLSYIQNTQAIITPWQQIISQFLADNQQYLQSITLTDQKQIARFYRFDPIVPESVTLFSAFQHLITDTSKRAANAGMHNVAFLLFTHPARLLRCDFIDQKQLTNAEALAGNLKTLGQRFHHNHFSKASVASSFAKRIGTKAGYGFENIYTDTYLCELNDQPNNIIQLMETEYWHPKTIALSSALISFLSLPGLKFLSKERCGVLIVQWVCREYCTLFPTEYAKIDSSNFLLFTSQLERWSKAHKLGLQMTSVTQFIDNMEKMRIKQALTNLNKKHELGLPIDSNTRLICEMATTRIKQALYLFDNIISGSEDTTNIIHILFRKYNIDITIDSELRHKLDELRPLCIRSQLSDDSKTLAHLNSILGCSTVAVLFKKCLNLVPKLPLIVKHHCCFLPDLTDDINFALVLPKESENRDALDIIRRHLILTIEQQAKRLISFASFEAFYEEWKITVKKYLNEHSAEHELTIEEGDIDSWLQLAEQRIKTTLTRSKSYLTSHNIITIPHVTLRGLDTVWCYINNNYQSDTPAQKIARELYDEIEKIIFSGEDQNSVNAEIIEKLKSFIKTNQQNQWLGLSYFILYQLELGDQAAQLWGDQTLSDLGQEKFAEHKKNIEARYGQDPIKYNGMMAYLACITHQAINDAKKVPASAPATASSHNAKTDFFNRNNNTIFEHDNKAGKVVKEISVFIPKAIFSLLYLFYFAAASAVGKHNQLNWFMRNGWVLFSGDYGASHRCQLASHITNDMNSPEMTCGV